MSYSIQEHLTDMEAHLAAVQAIVEGCPDAKRGDLPDGSHVWVSETVMPTRIQFVPGKHPGIVPYAVIGGVRVYAQGPIYGYRDACSALEALSAAHPAAYEYLVRWAWTGEGQSAQGGDPAEALRQRADAAEREVRQLREAIGELAKMGASIGRSATWGEALRALLDGVPHAKTEVAS